MNVRSVLEEHARTATIGLAQDLARLQVTAFSRRRMRFGDFCGLRCASSRNSGTVLLVETWLGTYNLQTVSDSFSRRRTRMRLGECWDKVCFRRTHENLLKREHSCYLSGQRSLA
jgi:hypothetical protein